MAHFELGVTLGTGSFGRVRFVTHKGTGTHWALKMLKKAEVIRLQQVFNMIMILVFVSKYLFERSSTCFRRNPFWLAWTILSL